jgi:hypothetical protein
VQIVAAACEAASFPWQGARHRQPGQSGEGWSRARDAAPRVKISGANRQRLCRRVADDGPEFEGFALAAELMLPPNIENTVAECGAVGGV